MDRTNVYRSQICKNTDFIFFQLKCTFDLRVLDITNYNVVYKELFNWNSLVRGQSPKGEDYFLSIISKATVTNPTGLVEILGHTPS